MTAACWTSFLTKGSSSGSILLSRSTSRDVGGTETVVGGCGSSETSQAWLSLMSGKLREMRGS